MRGDPWHQEPPLLAHTPEEVQTLSSALHDCWIDFEAIAWRREAGVVEVLLPLALDESEKKRLPDSEWRLVVRNAEGVKSEDRAGIGVYSLRSITATLGRLVIEAAEPLTIEIEARVLEVAVTSTSA